MAQYTTIIPRRYWGPGSTGDVGSSSGSPSQASVILARINERARARKAGKTPLVNGPYSEAQREHTTSNEPSSEETRKLTQEVTPFDEQLSNESKKDEKHEECSNKQNSTSKGEMVTAVKEILNDGYKLKKKSDKRKGVSDEFNLTSENRVNTLVNDEHIPCDMEAESPKRKKEINTEKESTSREEVLVNGIDSPSGTVGIAHDAQYKKKKKKKKELKDQDRKNSMEEMSCVSDTLTDDSFLKSPKKSMKKKRKSNTIDEDSLAKIGNDVVKESEDVLEDENFDELTKKKKKRKKEKCENEEKFTMTEDNVSSLENESGYTDFSMPETKKKKKKRKDKQKLPNEEINIQINEINEYSSTFSMLATKQKKKKRKDKQELPNEEYNVQISENECGSTFSMSETKQKKKKRKDKQELPNEENNVQISEINECGSTVVESEKAMYIEEHDEKTEPEKDHEVVDTKKSIDSEVIESKSELDTSTVNEKVTASKKKRKKKGKKTKVQDGEIEGFTLMREVKSSGKEKLQRTLPHWLANPTVIGRDLHSDGTSIDSIQGIDASLKKILEEQNIQQFFPVQKAVIPEILSSLSSLSARYRPRDICVSAPTGSGKTLAYVLPIIQALKGRTVPRIRALVLLPVQELAIQVYRVFQTYRRGSNLKVGIAVGQSTFQKEQASLVIQDYAGYRPAIDILVATPGRLDDHLKFTKGIDLSSLRYLVVDEADRMLAAEGGEWVTAIEQAVKRYEATSENALIGGFQRSGPTQLPQVPIHRLLFSATLSHDPEQLQHMTLYRPKLFTVSDTSSVTAGVKKKELAAGAVVGQYVRPAELKEEYALVDESVKPLVLHHLITTKSWRRVLVFTNSLETTHKLAVLMAAMSEGLTVAEFSSSQKNKRHQIVSQFASGKIDILISSDAMARGLDIPDIEHVVSYDVTSINTYVHRIGRTARAGKSGTALSLVTKDVMSDFRALLSSGAETATELIVSTEELEPYESLYVNALAKMKEIILQEHQKQREEMETNISRYKQQGRRDGRNRGSSTHSGVRKFVKRLQHSRRPLKIR